MLIVGAEEAVAEAELVGGLLGCRVGACSVRGTRAGALRQAGFHGDPQSRMLSWRKGILRSHGSPEEVPR